MRQKEVLQRVPLTKSDLNYWERRGLLNPRKVRWGTRKVRDYSEQDVLFLEQMCVFRDLGLPPQKACVRARAELEQRARRRLVPDVIGGLHKLREPCRGGFGVLVSRRRSGKCSVLLPDGGALPERSQHMLLRMLESTELDVPKRLLKTLEHLDVKLCVDVMYQFADETFRCLSRHGLNIDAIVSTNNPGCVLLGAFGAIHYQRSAAHLSAIFVRQNSDGTSKVDWGKLVPASRILIVDLVTRSKDEIIRLMEFFEERGCRIVAAATLLGSLSEQDEKALNERGCFVVPLFGQREVTDQLLSRLSEKEIEEGEGQAEKLDTYLEFASAAEANGDYAEAERLFQRALFIEAKLKSE